MFRAFESQSVDLEFSPLDLLRRGVCPLAIGQEVLLRGLGFPGVFLILCFFSPG